MRLIFINVGLFVRNMNQLDTELLEGYLDNLGANVVQQMLDLYVQQSQIYIDDINSSVAQESQQLWQEYCHKMKGATGSVGLLTLHTKLVACEKSVVNWQEKAVLVTEIKELNQQSIDNFNQWLSEQN